MKMMYLAAAAGALALSSAATAQSFVNGGFETGNTDSWTVVSSTYRGNTSNSSLNPTFVKTGPNSSVHSAVINSSYVDPNLGALVGATVYSGNFGYRVEDTTTGGYASLIEQRVNNYSDANIFFAWKAVLENGGHSDNESAAMVITLRDLTSGTDIISRLYNAGNGGGGIDSRFLQSGNYFYTAGWQIEQLAIDASLTGHDFLLSVIAADCEPTGHRGYVYLDGFGAVAPPPVDPNAVPEPATWAMLIGGVGMIGGSMRTRRRKTTVSFG